ncbi:MAG: HipA domain-containing protein [Actinobacteria bacterium]|nr:HipA domain-containing protein [Actinomycetota bacterium]MBU1609681.1 HipA domain-containing protein [Actinomycetota bacterium]MBU2316186.1 HipA domain-containing protein [Actinomycetota bacterium]MBU2385662.1 HipA domain-containing protein [Actinomycetota bacterium]
MGDLRVELYGTHVGDLFEKANTFDFRVADAGIERFGIGSTVLSYAVPLVRTARRNDAPLRRNFFDEVLPEGRARKRLAGNAAIASDYTVGMLRRYGRDVAGALQVWDPTAPGEPKSPVASPVDDAGIRRILVEVASTPIGNTTAARKSSLAGVQDKIVLAKTDDGWAEPLDGFPSTHIIKPVVPTLPTMIFDEEYGARIARHLGLTTYGTELVNFAGATALVIERYDRSPDTADGRIHQEDFNQALGFGGDGKYEVHGHIGIAAIAELLRRQIGNDATAELLRLTTLSVAVGNLDMHAKNVSVLHLPDGTARLAPAYDIVPQRHHTGFDDDFAFRINGIFEHDRIALTDLIAEGEKWKVPDAEQIVRDTVESIAEFVATQRPDPGAHHSLAEDIQRMCGHLLDGRGAGGEATPSPAAARAALRRKQKGLGSTPNGGTGGSFAAHERPDADIELREPPQSPGGWGGPVG